MARRKLPAAQRRAELVAAARRLFAAKGFAGTAVSDIAQEAGVAQGTFYWHFASKDELLRTVAVDIVEENIRAMTDAAVLTELTPVGQLRRIAEIFAAYVDAKRMFVSRLHHPENRALHDEVNQEAFSRLVPVLRTVIQQGVDQGVFSVANAEAAAAFIVAASQVVTEPLIFAQHEPPARLAADLLDFVLKGLGYQPPPATLAPATAPEGNEPFGGRVTAR